MSLSDSLDLLGVLQELYAQVDQAMDAGVYTDSPSMALALANARKLLGDLGVLPHSLPVTDSRVRMMLAEVQLLIDWHEHESSLSGYYCGLVGKAVHDARVSELVAIRAALARLRVSR